jgi:hypothetical protein
VSSLLAHGIGARGDLPLPLGSLLAGAVAALVISFAALAQAWRTPRFEALSAGRVVGRAGHPLARVFSWAGRLAGTVVVLTALWSALFVVDNTVENISPRIVYVFLWVILPLGSFLVGDLWRWLSPFEALAAWRDRRDRVAGVEREGLDTSSLTLYVPAAGLLVFHWLELAYHASASARILAWLLGAWIVGSSVGALLWGSEWLRSRDPLAVWCRLLGSASPIFVRDGQWGVRRPFVGLSVVPVQRGTVLVVLTVLGGTTFDGVTRTDTWGEIAGDSVGWSRTGVNTLGLLMTIAVLLVLYLAAIEGMQRLAGTEDSSYDDMFALALLPVAVGYSIAHYFSLAVFEGQFLLIQASDPFGKGWDLLGTRGDFVDYALVSTTVVAWVQALGIIVGHLAGVVVGHDRAVGELPEEGFERTQLPLLAVMVALTSFGLLLLVQA